MRSRAIATRWRHSCMAAGTGFRPRRATPSRSLAAILHPDPVVTKDLEFFLRVLVFFIFDSGADAST